MSAIEDFRERFFAKYVLAESHRDYCKSIRISSVHSGRRNHAVRPPMCKKCRLAEIVLAIMLSSMPHPLDQYSLSHSVRVIEV